MKRLIILLLLVFITCGPSEAEIQERIIQAVNEATSTTLAPTTTFTTTSTTSSTSTTVADSTTTSTTSSTSTTVGDSTTTSTTLDNSNNYSSAYLSDYTLYDEEFGTSVEVTISNEFRTIVSNAIPNHITGRFPNSGNPHTITEQNKIWKFPLNGIFTGTPTGVREPGVALNGIKFEPGTAETVSCNSGEVYRVEGLQQDYPLGMDINNAHVQPSGEYHYHGVSQLLIDVFSDSNDLVFIGFSKDGFLIYYSKSNNYKSSYQLSSTLRKGTNCTVSLRNQQEFDLEGTTPNGTYTEDWNYIANSGELDECNGAFINDQYAYVITNEYPYFPRCLMGEFTEQLPRRNRRP